MKPTLRILTALSMIAAMGLTACSTAKDVLAVGEAAEKNPGPCPESFALYEASRLVEFRGPEAYNNVGFTAEIDKVRSLCRYVGDSPISADLTLDISFGPVPQRPSRQRRTNISSPSPARTST